jgi:hypothetical protein
VLNGDPAAYSHELKAGGYYTANEAGYTKTLVKLFNEYMGKKAKLTAWKPPDENADTDPSPPPSGIIPPPPPIDVDDLPIPTPDLPAPVVDDEPDTEPDPKPKISKAGMGIMVIIGAILGLIGSCL